MASYNGYLVGVIERQMGIDEDEEIGDGSGKRKGIGKESPGVGVCIENDGQEGWRRF